MPKYLVETISMFRMRYVIDCENAVDAMDKVTMGMDEFAQKHLYEVIVSTRVVTDEEIPELFFEDAPYLQGWGPEKAFEYIHKIKY